MKEIGATLRKRREELGYTLEEMSNKTRISVAQLNALEEGDLEFFKDDLSYVRYFRIWNSSRRRFQSRRFRKENRCSPALKKRSAGRPGP